MLTCSLSGPRGLQGPGNSRCLPFSTVQCQAMKDRVHRPLAEFEGRRNAEEIGSADELNEGEIRRHHLVGSRRGHVVSITS